MNLSIRQKTLHSLVAMLFGITGIGVAQEPGMNISLPAPPCAADGNCPVQQISVAAVGAPPNGLAQVGVVSTGGMGIAIQESVQVVKNQPYQAIAITDVKQTLADGSHISQTTTATVARDSGGRTVRIQQLSTIGPWRSSSDSAQGSGPTLTTIFDPIANTHTDFTSDNKVAHVAKMPPPLGTDTRSGEGGFAVFSGGPAGGSAGGGIGPMTFAVQGRVNSSQAVPAFAAPDAKSESLGAKSIDGISVTGTKITTAIPVGAIGNDKDLVITRETWYSPDLNLVIQSTQTDPRFGETTYSLTNIQRSEPDPALFQVPAEYTIDKLPVVVRQR
jgi:hypothetical protein